MTSSSSVMSVAAAEDLLADETITWAIDRLRATVRPHGISVRQGAADASTHLHLLASQSAGSGLAGAADAESYVLRIGTEPDGVRITLEAGGARGFSYALTELADRIAGPEGLAALRPGVEIARPATPVRAVMRSFSSVHEDTPWFHDRRFWAEYLDHLAAQRFNRFQLAFGMQYNYGSRIDSSAATDNYLCFAYPFLLDVPGFKVRAEGVGEDERDRNLAALAHIARETRRRGMSFQLGLWNHAYDYGAAARHDYPVLGIGPETVAEYSAAALRMLLEAVPDIGGITFRVHYEGGVPEEAGRRAFWDRLFRAVSDAGRPIVVDLHAKGVDRELIDAVRKPNIVPMVSPKYWIEHMGLPYHQASIRTRERVGFARSRLGDRAALMGVTEGERRFTRYGYADLLDEDREIDVLYRMWPGTQRLLLWGDPLSAAGYGRHATFGGALGAEFCEPLYFKGRKGSGAPGRRDPYVRDDLRLGVDDWKKYRYTYLLWGRLMYDPGAPADTWRRFLAREYGAGADGFEEALSNLSRILPLVTVVHGVSGANNAFWPEVYTNLPVSPWITSRHYLWDTYPAPATWGGVETFDPELFAPVGEYAEAALRGTLTGKYGPLEVACWLERLAADGERAIERALASPGVDGPQVRRTVIDAAVLARLGRFFAGRLRAAVEYGFFERTGDTSFLDAAIGLTAAANEEYAGIVGVVKGVYQDEFDFGVALSERTHWSKELERMAEDLDALRKERAKAADTASGARPVRRESRPSLDGVKLESADAFERGAPLRVRLIGAGEGIERALLRYRHVNQAEEYTSLAMTPADGAWSADIPADFTDSTYPVMFFAEVTPRGDQPIILPGFDPSLTDQPYIVVHSTLWHERERSAEVSP